MERVALGAVENAFTRGGNRLCFIDPRDSTRCIKVLRPDRSPEIRRKQKGFPKNLRSVDSFNENLEEYGVWRYIEDNIGSQAFSLITRCYGFVDTNYGSGLVMDLVCDHDGKISKTLKQYLWEDGLTEAVKAAVEKFSRDWTALGMPSKKLLLHNMLLQKQSANNFQVYVIDGMGWSSMFPVAKYSKSLAKKRAEKKVHELWETIQNLINKKQKGSEFGYHGWMTSDQREFK